MEDLIILLVPILVPILILLLGLFGLVIFSYPETKQNWKKNKPLKSKDIEKAVNNSSTFSNKHKQTIDKMIRKHKEDTKRSKESGCAYCGKESCGCGASQK